jgi:hypothetical protein
LTHVKKDIDNPIFGSCTSIGPSPEQANKIYQKYVFMRVDGGMVFGCKSLLIDKGPPFWDRLRVRERQVWSRFLTKGSYPEKSHNWEIWSECLTTVMKM